MNKRVPFESVAAAAPAQARTLLPEWFPAGKWQGDEFVVGNAQGEPGDSLKFNIRKGCGLDFATGEKYGDLIRYQLEHIIEEGTKEERELSKLLKTRITQVQNKIDKLDERYFITGDLPEAKYKQLSTQLQEEKAAVEAELEALTVEDISNISELVNTAVSISANLAPTWVSSTFEQKLQLQKLVFPKGIVFDRQNRSFRTIAVNPAISVIAEISTSCKQKKKGQERFSSPLSLSAEREGLP